MEQLITADEPRIDWQACGDITIDGGSMWPAKRGREAVEAKFVDIAFVQALKWLSWESPVLVLYIVGMVAAVASRKGQPTAWKLTFAATAILLATSVGLTLASSYEVQARLEGGRTGDWFATWLPVVVMTGTFLRAVAFGLLWVALFRKNRGAAEASSQLRPARWACASIAVTAVALNGVGLASPAVYVSAAAIGGSRVYRGVECLLELPLALMYPAWWANPVFVVGVACLFRRNVIVAGSCGIVSLLLALSYCLDVLRDFENNVQPVRIGYWLWVSSMAALAGSLVLLGQRLSATQIVP